MKDIKKFAQQVAEIVKVEPEIVEYWLLEGDPLGDDVDPRTIAEEWAMFEGKTLADYEQVT
jgi:hypothetical protein